jgi:neutral ceramidase
MKAGASQVCITPSIGLDLGGYVERQQPSTGVHDDLYVRGLFLEEQDEKLLWLHCDLIGLSNEFVKSLKDNFRGAYGLSARQVIISATHTHSGPATIYLRSCGKVDDAYMAQLRQHMLEAARIAMADPEPVSLYFAEGYCHLAKDRRLGSNYQHVDNHLPILAFRKEDGNYLALLAIYAMHNVALSYENRMYSADVAGIAAEYARLSLPGKPITLLTNGASANTVPAVVSANPSILLNFGKRLGDTIAHTTRKSQRHSQQALCSKIEDIDLPLTLPSRQEVLDEYEQEAARYKGKTLWLRAITDWKDDTLAMLQSDPPLCTTIVLQVIRIGQLTLTAIGAEVFSRLGYELRAANGPGNYVISYANGNIGYLPFGEAYQEGGYEVETAYKFYGNLMIPLGSYEQVRDQAILLLHTIQDGKRQPQDFSLNLLETYPCI